MAVRIRLSRIGRKHVPFFRVVAVDGRKKRDGECLDNIGTYDALGTKIVRFDQELYDKWIKNGAQPSDSVRKIYRMHCRAQAAAAAPKVAVEAPVKEKKPKKAAPAAKPKEAAVEAPAKEKPKKVAPKKEATE